MKIEIDTKHDTKEHLKHLANMLLALSNSQSSVSVTADNSSGSVFDLFSNDQPAPQPQQSGGLFNMFSDERPSAPSYESQSTLQPSAPVQAPSNDLFSIFDSPKEQPQQYEPQPEQALPTEPGFNNVEDKKDDVRMVPY